MTELECDTNFGGDKENTVEDVNLLGPGTLEHSPKKTLTAEAQMGQISKIILGSLLAMGNIIFSQRFYDRAIKAICLLWKICKV